MHPLRNLLYPRDRLWKTVARGTIWAEKWTYIPNVRMFDTIYLDISQRIERAYRA